MATDVTMPRLSDSMEEGTILKWIVSEGDEVEKGQEIVEIETDKANMTYEADTAGTLIEIVVSEGETVPLGEVIARIGEASEKAESNGGGGSKEEDEEDQEDQEGEEDSGGDEADEDDQEEPDAESEPEGGDEEEPEEEQKQEQPQSSSSDNGAGDGERVKASPVARRVAKEQGVDLGSIEGSGPGGRIVKADVEAAADGGGGAEAEEKEEETPSEDGKPKDEEEGKEDKDESAVAAEPNRPEPAGDAGPKGEMREQELTRLQRTVSRRMAESKATAPDFALEVEIDMTECVGLREQLKQMTEKAPSFNDMIVRACAMALREHPRVNAAYRDGRFELYSRVNVGVAVAAQDALVVPTVFDADKKSLGEISRSVRELATKVRDGKITPPELSGGTFTVSNLGMYGIDAFTAVINPPQAALLAVGALKKKPIVKDGEIVARDMLAVNLVCDHRILYGADGAQFLARVRELLEQPLALAL
jgi:pyruvate dehydrogenase E2 component (dihydrolipoamide acetyltransferase)